MAVQLRIIRLTKAIDEGNHAAYEQLKALAKTDPDARRVLKTVKEPPKPVTRATRVPEPPKPDTHEQTVTKAQKGDGAAIAQLRKKADYEDIKAQNALGMLLMESDPDEARKWLIRSAKLPESMDALRGMAMKGDEKALKWLAENEGSKNPIRPKYGMDVREPVRDDLGYIRPPVKHKNPKIGDIFRLNDAKLQTGRKNSMVLIKEMKGNFVTVWSVTFDPGRQTCTRIMEPSLAGFATSNVYVVTDNTKVYSKDSLLEYRGSLGELDVRQFRLSA